MKIAKILVLALLILSVGVGTSYSVEIPLGNQVVKSATWHHGNITIVQTTTLRYWINGKLSGKIVSYETYFKNLIRSKVSQIYIYDGSGKLISPITRSSENFIYDKNNRLIRQAIFNRHYDTSYKTLSSERINLTYSYDAAGALTGRVNNTRFYNAKGELVSSSTSTTANTYNADGSLKQESVTYEECGADGKIRTYSKTVTDHVYYENGDSYSASSFYDINNKLCGKVAYISLIRDGQKTNYRVMYDVDGNGNVVHTNVYDNDGNEIADLGSNGYKQPSDIIKDIYNPADPYIRMTVNGDITLNSNKTWDLGSYIINASGNFAIGSDTNGYDIYANGDVTIESDKTIYLSAYSIYVNGNLTINSRESIILSSSLPINVTGSLSINANLDLFGSGSLNNGTVSVDPAANLTMSGDLSQRKDIENMVIQNNAGTCPNMAIDKKELLPIKP